MTSPEAGNLAEGGRAHIIIDMMVLNPEATLCTKPTARRLLGLKT